MRIRLWPKSGRVMKRRGAKQKQQHCPAEFLASPQTAHLQPSELPAVEHCSPTYSTDCKDEATSDTPPPVRAPQSAFKRLLSYPVKYLCTRAGAEVHDSAGLHEAVAYYMSGTLPRETRLWHPAGQYPQASEAWL